MSCSAKRDPNGTWHIQYRWTDWTGTKKKSQKRGFKTKKEAEEWYAHFILQQTSDPTMILNDFWEIYKADKEKRLRKTTMKQKEYVMKDKVLPYFGNTPINAITAPMIRKWQGEMIDKGFKSTYLKTINNQLSSILNYAVRFYELRSNPCHKAGSMGKSKADERPYWTLEEFQKFSDAIMDKRDSWMAFQILFWTGMRIGELLALQVKDVNFEDGTIQVDESLTRLDGEDLITAPKTESSVRVQYKEIPETEYDNLRELARQVLQISKDENASNEVAITYSLESAQLIEKGERYLGIALGAEHDVDPLSDSTSYHLIRVSRDCVVLVLHNHPSLSAFSLSDIQFLLRYETVKLMVVVTNLGNVSYVVKNSKYDFEKAVILFNEAIDLNNEAKNIKDLQEAADYFLKSCYNVGINYEKR